MRLCSQKFHISCVLHWYTTKKGLDTPKLLVGMIGYDVTVKIKGGDTVTTVKKSFFTCHNLCHNIAPKAMNPVLNALEDYLVFNFSIHNPPCQMWSDQLEW